MKELLRSILNLKDSVQASEMLKKWRFRASHMKSESFKTLCKKLKDDSIKLLIQLDTEYLAL